MAVALDGAAGVKASGYRPDGKTLSPQDLIYAWDDQGLVDSELVKWKPDGWLYPDVRLYVLAGAAGRAHFLKVCAKAKKPWQATLKRELAVIGQSI
jgi:hypothetical protein